MKPHIRNALNLMAGSDCEFLELAMAAIDQAGVDLATQKKIARLLDVPEPRYLTVAQLSEHEGPGDVESICVRCEKSHDACACPEGGSR